MTTLPELVLPTVLNAVKKAYPDKYDWAIDIEVKQVIDIIDASVLDDDAMPTKPDDEINWEMHQVYFWDANKDDKIALAMRGLLNDYHAHLNTIYCKG